MKLKISKEAVAAMVKATEARCAEIRATPGYEEVLAETLAEHEAAVLLRDLAKRSKLTQKEIARRMNVSQPRISQIRNGEDLSLSTLYRYAAACGAKLTITANF